MSLSEDKSNSAPCHYLRMIIRIFCFSMPLTREQKQNIIKDLTDKFHRAKAAILVDFNKLSVAKTMELRRLLKQIGAEYKVAKKTLINRVLRSRNYKNADLEEFKTQVGVVFSYGDPVPTASSLFKFSKINEGLKILGGFLNFDWMDKNRVVAMAKLPSSEILLGQLAGTMAAPLSGLVNVLQSNIRNLVSVLDSIKSKK